MTRPHLALAVLAALAGPAAGDATPFAPRPDSAIPDDAFGAAVKEGRAIFAETATHAAAYVGNRLACANCHLDDGRRALSAPLAQAYVAYPAYRAKTREVETFEERLRGCFRYSMNGKAPPLGDPVLVALDAYAYFLAKGAPLGEAMPGRGYLALPRPAAPPDFARGAAVFAARCAVCHGADGAGQQANGKVLFPALWGGGSFNWGAGMARVDEAAGFIKAFMPLGQGYSLSDREAWDVAIFVDGHERPQDPRFTGDVAATRAAFHDDPMSLYGLRVDGVLLGAGGR